MNNIFKRDPAKTQIATALETAGISSETVTTRKGANVIDVLQTLDRRSQLAGLRSLCNAVQFTLINTADWMVRQEQKAEASDLPSLDERNAFDEFARGQDEADEVDRLMLGREREQTPTEKLQQYSRLYYGLVHAIRALHPQPFERPQGIRDALVEFTPRGAVLDDATLKLLEAAETEPGEFAAARDAFKTKRTAEMAKRKPRILEILEEHADVNPMLEEFDELPVQVRIRLTTAVWKGVFWSRKSLVGYIGQSGKLDDLAAVKTMAADLEILGKFCEELEADPDTRTILDLLMENGVRVYGIDDARADVKKPRQQ